MEEIRLTAWDVKPINNGINYQAQLVSWISEPSTVVPTTKQTYVSFRI